MNRFLQWVRAHLKGMFGAAMLLCIAAFGVTYHREIWAILTNEAARDAFIAWVRDSGWTGLAVFLGVQVLQVVVAFLPGEPVELAAGLIYGTWGGLALCLVGIFLSSMAVYYTAKLLGAHAVSGDVLKKYRFLRDEAHVHFALFLLFFIPGTPKDVLVYAGPFLPVSARSFFLLSTLARIPSILTSTFAASSFAGGNWMAGAAVYALTGAAALVCALNEERLLAWFRRRRAVKK